MYEGLCGVAAGGPWYGTRVVEGVEERLDERPVEVAGTCGRAAGVRLSVVWVVSGSILLFCLCGMAATLLLDMRRVESTRTCGRAAGGWSSDASVVSSAEK